MNPDRHLLECQLPPPIRCTCNRVLPHERYADLLRRDHTPLEAFEKLKVRCIMCRVCLTTSFGVELRAREPSSAVHLPPLRKRRYEEIS